MEPKQAGHYAILKNPITVKALARQIITASDSYTSMALSEKDFRELIYHYARYHGNKLFSASGPGIINPTIINRIGKKRIQLIILMLEGF